MYQKQRDDYLHLEIEYNKSMNYTTLYYFMNEKHSVIEVKVNDLPEGASKEEEYKWLHFSNEKKEIQQLHFVSQGEEMVNNNKMNIRVFKNAEIRFDTAFAKLMLEDEGHILMNSSQELLPTEIDTKIIDFLS